MLLAGINYTLFMTFLPVNEFQSFIEIALELLYFGSTLDAKGFSITIAAWVYQAALFSVPCFLSVLYFVHDFRKFISLPVQKVMRYLAVPQEAMRFLCSYNLVQFMLFINEKPALAVVVYCLC